jgi:hypothetical protein
MMISMTNVYAGKYLACRIISATSRILGVCYVAYYCFGACEIMTSEGMPISNPFSNEGLKVIGATDPTFTEEVTKLLDTNTLSKAAPLIPFALILTNDTNRYIYSFTVVYTYPKRIAPAGTPWKFQMSPTAATPDNRRTMIAPGATLLVAPVGDFLVWRDASGKKMRTVDIGEGMARIIKLFETDDAHDRIEASIDSIIFENGEIGGPDETGKWKRSTLE